MYVTRRLLRSTMLPEGSSLSKEAVKPKEKDINDKAGWSNGLGLFVDARDVEKEWSEAKIMEVDPSKERVFLHYVGWNTRFDAWVSVKSLAAHATHTDGVKKKDMSWDGKSSLFDPVCLDDPSTQRRLKHMKKLPKVARAKLDKTLLDLIVSSGKDRKKAPKGRVKGNKMTELEEKAKAGVKREQREKMERKPTKKAKTEPSVQVEEGGSNANERKGAEEEVDKEMEKDVEKSGDDKTKPIQAKPVSQSQVCTATEDVVPVDDSTDCQPPLASQLAADPLSMEAAGDQSESTQAARYATKERLAAIFRLRLHQRQQEALDIGNMTAPSSSDDAMTQFESPALSEANASALLTSSPIAATAASNAHPMISINHPGFGVMMPTEMHGAQMDPGTIRSRLDAMEKHRQMQMERTERFHRQMQLARAKNAQEIESEREMLERGGKVWQEQVRHGYDGEDSDKGDAEEKLEAPEGILFQCVL